MGDLVAAELPRYKKLLEEGEENWRSLTASLLADSALLSDPKVVADLAADLLWDGYQAPSVRSEHPGGGGVRIDLQHRLAGGERGRPHRLRAGVSPQPERLPGEIRAGAGARLGTGGPAKSRPSVGRSLQIISSRRGPARFCRSGQRAQKRRFPD